MERVHFDTAASREWNLIPAVITVTPLLTFRGPFLGVPPPLRVSLMGDSRINMATFFPDCKDRLFKKLGRTDYYALLNLKLF